MGTEYSGSVVLTYWLLAGIGLGLGGSIGVLPLLWWLRRRART